MAIRREKSELVATCNNCGREDRNGSHPDDFRTFLQSLREQGWKMTKQDGEEWQHYCPDCK